MSCLVGIRRQWWLVLVAAVAASLSFSLSSPAQAADPLKDGTALKFVPDNVGFYSATLRAREQYDAFVNSKAFAKLQAIPALQMGLFLAKGQWDNPQNPQLARFKLWLEDDSTKQVLETLKDAVSQEVFFFGDKDWGAFAALLNELNTASSAGQLEALAAGESGQALKHQLGKILEVLDKQQGELKIPQSLIGAKLTNVERAEAQLVKLEALLQGLFAQQPTLQKAFAKEHVGDADYLTLRLDGSLIPWEQIPTDESAQEEIKRLIEKLKQVKLVISLGIRDGYFLLSIGSDNAQLGNLGKASLLADRPELAALRNKAGEPITGITYVSDELAKSVGSVNRQMDQLVGMAKQLIPMSPLSPKLQEELVADVESLAGFIKSSAAEPGAMMSFSYMTPEGYEAYSYNWAKQKNIDASQKLTILEHVGGTPLAFVAGRAKSSRETVDQLAKFAGRGFYYAEQVLLEQVDEQQQQAYETLKKDLMPLVERAGQVARDKLLPALSDQQTAIVLDAKLTSKQWHVAMPPADKPLPMLELAVVEGVSDAGKLREAFGDYFTILQELLDKLHAASTGELKDFFPNEIPKIELAKPKARDVDNGTVYYYALPEDAGLDEQFAPNAGLSDSMLVISLFPKFTARLLKDEPLQGTGPLANVDRPLAGAGYLNFAGLIEAIEPWIDYGIGLSMQTNTAMQPGLGPGAAPGGGPAQTVTDVLDVLKCFRSVSTVVYQEDDALVSHTQCKFEDLK